MRKGFVNKLFEIMRKDENVYFLTGDLGFSYFETFAKKFPERFFNMGVSEQNMIGVASGLSLSGKTVFVYSIIPFLIYRPFEQIKLDVCSMNSDVKLVGYGGGFSYGQLGITHFAVEDIGVMRSLPNMTIVCPADEMQSAIFTELIYEHKGPAYMRLSGNYTSVYESTGNYSFTIGKGVVLRDGKDIALISNGNLLGEALKTAEILEKSGYSISVVDMHTVKPIDADLICTISKSVNFVFTIEEHNIIGGLGSAVAEVLTGICRFSNFKAFGVNDEYIKFIGNHSYIRRKIGLDSDCLSKSILSVVECDKK